MPEPYGEIRSVEHAVEIGVKLPDNWFRGHQEAVDALTPRFFREYDDPVMTVFKPSREMEFIEAFKRDAPAVGNSDELPDEDDTLGWLKLMQHYRTPTRLLDWTENVLPGLYFSVSDSDLWGEEDGELWGLNPYELNTRAAVGPSFPLPGRNPVIDYLVREPYWRTNEQGLADELADKYSGRVRSEWREDPEPFPRPVAFRPRRDFERMRVQASVFTIHPRTEPEDTIPAVLTDERHLVRYIIPKESKRRIWKELRAIGVTEKTLFPDFEGLSETLTPPEERIARGDWPEPPTFDDEPEA